MLFHSLVPKTEKAPNFRFVQITEKSPCVDDQSSPELQADHGCIIYMQWRRPGAEFGGDGIFFRGARFLNEVFPEKNSIFTPKISDDYFFVIAKLDSRAL